MNPSDHHSQHHSARRLTGAGVILMGSQMIGMVLQLLIFSTIQHQFSQTDNGTFFWIQQISGLAFLIIAEMGMNSIVTRMYVEHQDTPEQQNRVITTFFGLRLGLWSLTTLGVCLFVTLTEPVILTQTLLYAIYLGIAARGALFRMVLEIRQRAINDQMLPALAGISDVTLMSLVVLFFRDNLTLSLVMVLFVLTSLPGFIVMILNNKQWKLHWRQYDTSLAVSILRETSPILVSIVMMQIQDKCDTIALNAYFGREALGAFGAVMRVIVPCISLLMIISGVIAPVITRLQLKDIDLCKQFVLKGLQWTILASALCAVLLGVFANEILILTAGRQYQPFATALSFAAWTLFPGMIVAYLLAILTALGIQRQALPMMIGLALAAITGNFVLTAKFSIMGAIAARIIATILASTLGLWVLDRFLEDTTVRILLGRTLVFVLLMFGTQTLLNHALYDRTPLPIPDNSVLLLVIKGILVLSAFSLLAVSTGVINRNDLSNIKGILRATKE